MNKIIVPLEAVTTPGVSCFGVEANLPAWLCESRDRIDHLGAYKKVTFRVDPGSHFTSMGIDYAREIGLELPQQVLELNLATAAGRTRSRFIEGPIYSRIVGLEAHLIEFPCIFFENRPRTVPPLLGLGGVLQSTSGHILRLLFEGTPAPGARHGTFTVEILHSPSDPA